MDASQKTCPMCCLPILEKARKCPHCQHYLSRTALLFHNPAFMALYATIPMLALMIVFSTIFDPGENYEQYQDQIQVSNSRIEFGQVQSGPTVVVFADIQNKSSVPWKNLEFHLEFSDSTGHLADVGQKEMYSFHVPPGETYPVKLSFRREFPESAYSAVKIRVLTAKDSRARF